MTSEGSKQKKNPHTSGETSGVPEGEKSRIQKKKGTWGFESGERPLKNKTMIK